MAMSLVVGIASSATAAVKVTEHALGFSFSLPAHWKVIPLHAKDVTQLLNAATKSDPALTGALTKEIRQAAHQGVKVFAVAPVLMHTNPNLNIIVESSAGVPTGAAFFVQGGATIKRELASSGFSHVKVSDVTGGFGKVIQVTYQIKSALTGQVVHGVQFYVRHTTRFYIITTTAPTSAYASSVSNGVATSWHWS